MPNHRELIDAADMAFKAWVSNPDNRDLERNYREASEAVRKSSMTIFRQSLGLDDVDEYGEPQR